MGSTAKNLVVIGPTFTLLWDFQNLTVGQGWRPALKKVAKINIVCYTIVKVQVRREKTTTRQYIPFTTLIKISPIMIRQIMCLLGCFRVSLGHTINRIKIFSMRKTFLLSTNYLSAIFFFEPTFQRVAVFSLIQTFKLVYHTILIFSTFLGAGPQPPPPPKTGSNF